MYCPPTLAYLVERNPRAAGRVIGEAAFVVTPDNSTMHTLNKTGAAVWTAAQPARTLDELADVLCARFAIDRAQARADVERFVEDLVAREILVRTDLPGADGPDGVPSKGPT